MYELEERVEAARQQISEWRDLNYKAGLHLPEIVDAALIEVECDIDQVWERVKSGSMTPQAAQVYFVHLEDTMTELSHTLRSIMGIK